MAYDYNLAPKALSEQCAAFKKKYPTLDDLPADEYIMMPKYDGCLAIVVADDEGHVLTRTGEPITSIPHVLAQARKLLPGYVIFGEAYKFDTPFKDISGAFRRHAPQDDLIVVAFDAVPVADWRAGKCDESYRPPSAFASSVAIYPLRRNYRGASGRSGGLAGLCKLLGRNGWLRRGDSAPRRRTVDDRG